MSTYVRSASEWHSRVVVGWGGGAGVGALKVYAL